MYLYLDESGDLGFNFKGGSSRYFVVALLLAKDPKPLGRCLKKARHPKLGKDLKERPELKASQTSEKIQKIVLRCIAQKEVEIHTIVMYKPRVRKYLREEKEKLYNYVCGLLIEDCAQLSLPEVTLVVDRRGGRRIVREFNRYIRFKAEARMSQGEYPTRLRIYHKSSQSDPGLQAVDFVCHGVWRSFELKNPALYEIIKKRIKVEKELFFPSKK